MYVIVAPLQIKEGHKAEFLKAMLGDAQGSINNEPDCLQFDVIQDGSDPNRIWLYEVYKDKSAFESHTKTLHFLKWKDTVKDWMEDRPTGAGAGSYNIWPPDENWDNL